MDSQEFNFQLKVTEKQLFDFQEDPIALEQLIDQDIRRTLQEFVFDNLKDKDGSPEVADIAIKGFQYEDLQKTGKFRLQFMVDRRFCCADTSSCAADYIDINFHYQDGEMLARGTYFDWSMSN